MGCNKSKSEHGGSEAHVNAEHPGPWELGQEAHSFYEFNQTGISNSGFHPEQLPDYSYSNLSGTGSFGDPVPSYSPNSGFNNMQYFGTNEYNVNACNRSSIINGSSPSTNSMYNNCSQEQYHSTYIQHQYHNQEQMCGALDHESIMGPPSRPISRAAKSNYNMPRLIRPLARRRSFNDDYRRAHQNTHCNIMVRHGSLENIPTGSRIRNSINNFASDNNLFWNGNGEYPTSFNPKWRNSGRQRGLKRNSWDDDPLDSKSSEVVPHVKRRPSDIDDPCTNSEGGKVGEEEVNRNNEGEVIHKSAEQPNLVDETFDILDLLMFPEEWSSCAVDRTGLVDISLISPEGKSVHKYFSRSSQSKDFKLCITAISRIENPFMHSYYLLKKQEMESRNEHVDELYLYHGTKKKHLSGILEDNLNWRLYSEKHRFGQGVSFSPVATYSSHYSDKTSQKVMLLFKVLASNSIGGSPDMKVPPIIDNVVYDTSIKDDTTVIVKYSDNEFYPLYTITYLKIMRN